MSDLSHKASFSFSAKALLCRQAETTLHYVDSRYYTLRVANIAID